MTPILISTLVVLAGYLLGALPFAVIVSGFMGLPDPRAYGSGNPGATNVLRSGNKVAAVLTLLGDAGKGYLAVALAFYLQAQLKYGDATIALVALAAFFGHVFSIFLRFNGGKGVATAAGVLLAIDWRLGALTLAAWVAVAALTRYSSLAAIVAALFAPVAAFMLFGDQTWFPAASVVMAATLVWRHAANIQKLMSGQESKIGAKK